MTDKLSIGDSIAEELDIIVPMKGTIDNLHMISGQLMETFFILQKLVMYCILNDDVPNATRLYRLTTELSSQSLVMLGEQIEKYEVAHGV